MPVSQSRPIVRRAAHGDDELLIGFNLAMARESEDKGLDPNVLAAGVRNLLARPADGFYLVAEVDGQVAGSLMVTFEWSDWRNGRFWWIQSVYVDPGFRRRGVYSAMHHHVRSAAKADPEGCGIRLYVEKANTGAQTTYHTLGMVTTHYQLFEEEF